MYWEEHVIPAHSSISLIQQDALVSQLCHRRRLYNYSLCLAACDCPSGDMCNVLNGQCECETNVEGRQCDRCVGGSYGTPPDSCTVRKQASS